LTDLKTATTKTNPKGKHMDTKVALIGLENPLFRD
jgi:hypothetical protein